jgi:hypothetical protein
MMETWYHCVPALVAALLALAAMALQPMQASPEIARAGSRELTGVHWGHPHQKDR